MSKRGGRGSGGPGRNFGGPGGNPQRFRDRGNRGGKGFMGGPGMGGPRGGGPGPRPPRGMGGPGPMGMGPPDMMMDRGPMMDDMGPPMEDFPPMRRPGMGPPMILVGNLPRRGTRQDLETRFARYGPIIDIQMRGDHAILEYASPMCGEEAINREHGAPFYGHKLVVEWKRGGPEMEPDALLGPPPGGDGFRREIPSLLDGLRPNSGMLSLDRPGPPFGGSSFGAPPVPMSMSMGEPLGPPEQRPPMFDEGFRRDGGRGESRFESFGDGPQGQREDFSGPTSNGGSARGAMPAPPADGNAKKKDPTDLEIIVLNKLQTRYAEMVERKLRTLGITVDLLFPREGAPIPAILASIAKRGALYAAVISPQNEKDGSISINILYGNTTEQRDIPLDDAVKVIGANFQEFNRRGGRGGAKDDPGPRSDAALPESVRSVFAGLLEGRPLSDADYGKAIGFLQDKREAQFLGKPDGGGGMKRPSSSGMGGGDGQASKMQKKSGTGGKQDGGNQGGPMMGAGGGSLMSNMGGGPVGVPPLSGPGGPWPPPPGPGQHMGPGAGPGGINFNSPSVQHALDNLMAAQQPMKPGQQGPRGGVVPLMQAPMIPPMSLLGEPPGGPGMFPPGPDMFPPHARPGGRR